ncbi:hypothetical protein [Rhodoplanes roseus]|uniref:Chemotaxis protein n=1 Tax=Rhodoplanes roseus TaxID=29409 RepID=A0A327L7U1_9BRAD|nr:hypothetical protein [Rhodoplanes roseus]RAI45572.1 hypothetical protein CH341_03185 [Rhodoplanes roseus]
MTNVVPFVKRHRENRGEAETPSEDGVISFEAAALRGQLEYLAFLLGTLEESLDVIFANIEDLAAPEATAGLAEQVGSLRDSTAQVAKRVGEAVHLLGTGETPES